MLLACSFLHQEDALVHTSGEQVIVRVTLEPTNTMHHDVPEHLPLFRRLSVKEPFHLVVGTSVYHLRLSDCSHSRSPVGCTLVPWPRAMPTRLCDACAPRVLRPLGLRTNG